MPRDLALDPDARGLYGEMLRPPPGYAFDRAVGTTYSLDFDTALAVPVALSLHMIDRRDEVLESPLALLEGLERSLGRLAVFCEAGRLQARLAGQSRLCALLEGMIVEAAAPGGGAFHPKLWLLRYTAEGLPAKLRLLILSRNLTRDDSWDLCLSLDGDVGAEPDPEVAPIADLVAALPGLATGPVPPRAAELAETLADDARHARWEPPAPFDAVSFAVNGLGGHAWRPAPARRMGVLSPFCSDAALRALVPERAEPEARLVGRSEELAALAPGTLARFARVQVLDELAEAEDGEDRDLDAPPGAALKGLHAKGFLAERGWRTELTVGSGNATTPALLTGDNVEVFSTLSGLRSRVGSVEDLLGETSFGRLLRDFVPGEADGEDPERAAAEDRLERARRALARAGLVMECGPEAEDADRTLDVALGLARPLEAPIEAGLEVWPVTLGAGHARPAEALPAGGSIPLGRLALRDVSRFVALRLTDAASGLALVFGLGAELRGLPEDRDAAILRSVVSSRETFLRYLRLLLSDLADPFGAALEGVAAQGRGGAGPAGEDQPLLEEMVRALSRDGARLRDVARLVARLRSGRDAEAVIPETFLELWSAFEAVMETEGRAR